VLGLAASALVAARPDPTTWLLFGAGVGAYASGHGIHLAANSINNAAPGETAHLWDETVGHAIWYAGVALVIAALARTMAGQPRPRLLGHLLALAVGITWASNALGTDNLGLAIVGLLVAATFSAYGWAHRDGLAVTLLIAFVSAIAWLAVGLLVA
jgi:hypothetical protein